jgi:hypothetical protein
MNEYTSRLRTGLAVVVAGVSATVCLCLCDLLSLAGGCTRSDPIWSSSHMPQPASTQPGSVASAAADHLAVNGPILLIVHAHGFQIYSRVAVADTGNAGAWKLKAPDAEFSSDDGVKGRHYAGPTWETADGTKVVGVKIAEQASPDPKAVPWLLLKVVSHEGNGPIGAATYVKRINTTGGKLPEDRPQDANEMRVPYTADYVFYGAGATTRP